MKKLVYVFALLFSLSLTAQTGWNPDLIKDANVALKEMIKKTPKLQTFKSQAYAYAVYPKVTKAGIGIGGAAGKGVVYISHKPIASSKLKQASFGFQFGGQQYSEVIFFKDKEAFERFKNGKLKFDGQASAVALKEGASLDVSYSDGVAVFTQTKGGLMYEASIGGQHFTYKEN